MFDHWNTVKTVTVGNFEVEIAWAYEDQPLSAVFDNDEDIEIHQKRCEDYTDTHFIARVRALYDDKVLGSDYLGSCYAYGRTPEDCFNDGLDGYLEQMISTAISEAQNEAVAMIDRLKADFLN